jgi:hypothetical protein
MNSELKMFGSAAAADLPQSSYFWEDYPTPSSSSPIYHARNELRNVAGTMHQLRDTALDTYHRAKAESFLPDSHFEQKVLSRLSICSDDVFLETLIPFQALFGSQTVHVKQLSQLIRSLRPDSKIDYDRLHEVQYWSYLCGDIQKARNTLLSDASFTHITLPRLIKSQRTRHECSVAGLLHLAWDMVVACYLFDLRCPVHFHRIDSTHKDIVICQSSDQAKEAMRSPDYSCVAWESRKLFVALREIENNVAGCDRLILHTIGQH